MPQPVGEDRADPGALPGSEHRLGDPAAGQPAVRRPHPQEHLPGSLERLRPAIGQVSGERFTRIGGQRQPFSTAALAAHGDLPGPPADVIQAQRGDLPGAQPEPGQQRQHREITAPGRGALVAAGQQRRHLPRPQRLGQPGQPPAGHRGHRVAKRLADQALHMQESEQRSQRGHRQLRRALRLTRTGSHHERGDLARRQGL
jgi:hypothetical protein